MGEKHCCFIIVSASAQDVIVLASITKFHSIVTLEAFNTAEREGYENWKMLTMSFMQLGSSVCKYITRRRIATSRVTLGALHRNVRTLDLQAILRVGIAFSFVRGRWCDIYLAVS